MAKKLRVKKREILDHTGDNLAVKLALAETHIINETKAYFESVCISLNKVIGRRFSCCISGVK